MLKTSTNHPSDQLFSQMSNQSSRVKNSLRLVPCLLMAAALFQGSGCTTKLATDQPAADTLDLSKGKPSQAVKDKIKKRKADSAADAKAAKEAPKSTLSKLAPLKPQNATQKAEGEKAKLRYEQGIILMQAKKFDEAYQVFSEVAKQYPSLSGPIVNQAIILRGKKNYTAAESLLKGALLSKAKSPYLYNELGIVYRHMGKFESARSAYKAAIKLAPNYDKAHYNLAVLADLYLHDKALAIKEFTAYQALQTPANKVVAAWIKELKRRGDK